jgi:phage/conjugal plasmid C-4 type zinc finger TraR family protein
VSDVFDRASEREDTDRAIALQEQQARAGFTGKTVADSALDCRVCDEAIPALRRGLLPGVQTCVACQEELERAARLGL